MVIERVEPKMYNKDGSLTTFALHCGYIQIKYIYNIRVELFHDGCYHVKVYNCTLTPSRQRWISIHNLTEARARFKYYVRRYKDDRQTIKGYHTGKR